jgi:hypothetical protein
VSVVSVLCCTLAERCHDLDVEAVLLDLTEQIRREGRCALIPVPVRVPQVLIPCFSYPQAHGGFADVWKGVWDRQPDRWVCRVPTFVNLPTDHPSHSQVAIKVLRSRLDDPQMERKMNKVCIRLSYALAWRN